MRSIAEQRVFIVDDEPSILRVLSETLESIGVKTTCFSHALDCLEQLQSQKCDLLITDLKMPVMDGIELLRQVKEIIPWLPVLIITGYGSIKDAVDAIKSGAADIVEKPILKENFLQKIQSILQQNASFKANIHTSLTNTELELLRLIWANKTYREIANVLNCTERTIEDRRAKIMKKCGVKNLIGLFKICASIGLIDLPSKRTKANLDSSRNLKT